VPGCTTSPPSSSRPTTAFAPRLLFPIRPAILIPSPSRGRWFTYIRAVPSAVVSSTASNVYYARPSCTPTRSQPELAQREHCHALHAAALHVVALFVNALHSSSCCRAHTRLGLAASHVHMSEPRASLTRSHFAGSASLLPRLAFRRTPWLRPRYGHRVPASRE
jgi:hypothetical protein